MRAAPYVLETQCFVPGRSLHAIWTVSRYYEVWQVYPIPEMDHEELLKTYEEQRRKFEDFGNTLLALFDELFQKSGLSIHSIYGRLKDPSSLKAKILTKKKYDSLFQVTDLVGIRVITYFENELDYLCQLIEEHFLIDRENSVDKSKLETDRFGYKSVHYVISGTINGDSELDDDRFTKIKAEVQVRTILQHAWAEIEHDLGYKSLDEVPDTIKRRFFRIAALLEVADTEFVRLRTDLVQSKKELLPHHISNLPNSDSLSVETLRNFLMESAVAMQLDKRIVDVTGGLLHYNPNSIERNFRQLEEAQINTTARLEELLRQHGDEIIALYKKNRGKWILHLKAFPEKHGSHSSPRGICITYLSFLLMQASIQ